MYVAVGDVPERDDPRPRIRRADHGGHLGREPHPVRRWHRHVELDRDAEEPGRLRMAFPVVPQPSPVGGGLADGGGKVADYLRQVVERARTRRVKQEVRRGRRGQRRHKAGVRDENVKSRRREELRGDQPGHRRDRLPGERVHRGKAVDPDDRGHGVSYARDQAEPRPGDHGQRAFRAREQRGVVVAGVVLGEPGQVRHHGAVGQHGLDAAQLRAHRPVAQHPHTASVRRHRAPDSRAFPAGDLDPQVKVRVGIRDPLQRNPGARRDLGCLLVSRLKVAEPGEAEHHLAVQWHAAADQAGVTALGHDGHPGIPAQGEHRRDSGGVPWPDDSRRLPAEPPRPVDGVPGGRVPGQDVLRAYDARQRPGQRAGKRFHPPVTTLTVGETPRVIIPQPAPPQQAHEGERDLADIPLLSKRSPAHCE